LLYLYMSAIKQKKIKIEIKPLSYSLLISHCDPEQFDFKTTDEIPELAFYIGQQRALHAAKFGLGIKCDGFNIFALGPAGIGKRSVFKALLTKEASMHPTPNDICYVHNFKEPRKPHYLLLPPGMGKKFQEDMHSLVGTLRVSIPAIFESEAYRVKIKNIQELIQEKQEKAFNALEDAANARGFAIMHTPDGFVLNAMKDGKVLSEEEFAALPKEERETRNVVMRELYHEISNFLEQIPNWQKEQRQEMKDALRYFIVIEVGTLIKDVKKAYENQPSVLLFLNEVQQAITDHPGDFRKEEGPSFGMPMGEKSRYTRYRVNVLVDNSGLKGAPVVYEDNPSLTNLVGRIDQVSQFGALVTDFTLLSAGALHKANGGYLLIDALKLLSQPYAWEALKRALRAKEIRMENIGQMTGFFITVSLEPEPIPLNIKVVLFGERNIYYILCAYDPEFAELFKVAADFEEEIERNKENQLLFAQLLKGLAAQDNLKPLAREAVARMVDYSSRMIGDSKKISTHVRSLADLLREADHWAQLEKSSVIDRHHIEKAIIEQEYRASRIKDEQYEHIARGLKLISTEGSEIGQINGLAYLQLGTLAFGIPTRISATVHIGSGEVVDIERQVRLGGPIHSKGVLILSGYLSGQFAKDIPLSLSASLVFEQSYGGIEGDSASAAELAVLLSAIAQIPLKQGIALTGSVNQHGQIQAIGGINEKIEGFFDICRSRGLNGEQGVIMPKANVDMLMLRPEVVMAAKEGLFNVYAVAHIDEVMTILTGLNAGVRNKAGNFPKGSVNYLVEMQLLSYSQTRLKSKKRFK
jgi:lon-related putative ATP-dependent protease